MNLNMDIVPVNIDEALKMFLAALTKEEKKALYDVEEKQIAIFHHTLGEDIRNDWSMSVKNTPLVNDFKMMGITHPDDMSGIILISTYRILHDKPIKLKEQIEKYQAYWKKEIGRPIP